MPRSVRYGTGGIGWNVQLPPLAPSTEPRWHLFIDHPESNYTRHLTINGSPYDYSSAKADHMLTDDGLCADWQGWTPSLRSAR